MDNSKNPSYFAILNKNVSKLTGLYGLCEVLGITMQDVIAFGDDYNDYDILQNSGHAVVMANAADGIKEIADDICKSNDEDGVAQWIQKNLL